jgi:hypothetical protein
MLSKRLRDAMAHVPGREAELGYRVAQALDRRFPEAEPAIAADAGWAPNYIEKFIKGRWPAAETAMAQAVLDATKDPDSLSYNIIGYVADRVAEAGVVVRPSSIQAWAQQVLAGTTTKTASSAMTIQQIRTRDVLQALDRYNFMSKDLRKAMFSSPNMGMNFAFAVGHPVPDAEPAIATSAQNSYSYALNNKAPFPAGEPAIAQDPELACRYAMGVLRDRFPEAEPIIAKTFLDLVDGRPFALYRLRCVISNYYWSLIAKNDMQEGEGPVLPWAEAVLAGEPTAG